MIERGGHRVDTRDVATRSPGGRNFWIKDLRVVETAATRLLTSAQLRICYFF